MASANKEHDPDRLWLNKGATFNVANSLSGLPSYNRNHYGWYLNILADGRYEVAYDDPGNNDCLGAIASPSVLLQTDVVTLGEKTDEGELVKSVRQTWGEIVKQIRLRYDFLFEFTKASRAFEMFLAATYRMDGFDEVILTPRSNDRGRDVIASKTGRRILEQAKAYGVKRRVTHEEVRAMASSCYGTEFPAGAQSRQRRIFHPLSTQVMNSRGSFRTSLSCETDRDFVNGCFLSSNSRVNRSKACS